MDNETIVLFPKPAYSLSWAPIGGGFPKKLRGVINLTCAPDVEYPSIITQARLARDRIAISLSVSPKELAIMITAVPQSAGAESSFRHEKTGLEVKAFCTVGLGNAVAVGESPSFDEESHQWTSKGPGTINVIIAVNRPLTRSAMLESLSSAVVGKATAVAMTRAWTDNETPALATGTDCITLSSVSEDVTAPLHFAGLHTVLGQFISSAVKEACLACLAKKSGNK